MCNKSWYHSRKNYNKEDGKGLFPPCRRNVDTVYKTDFLFLTKQYLLSNSDKQQDSLFSAPKIKKRNFYRLCIPAIILRTLFCWQPGVKSRSWFHLISLTSAETFQIHANTRAIRAELGTHNAAIHVRKTLGSWKITSLSVDDIYT